MRLLPITTEDEDLTVRLECDPELMRHIGGPRPEADVRVTHKRRLALMAQGVALRGPFDNEGFAGILRCNDWCIELCDPH